MTCRGRVQDGVVILDSPSSLPNGALVNVVLVKTADEDEVDPLFRMAELAVDMGVPDLAMNIDHYLYGHPKVEDEQ